MVVVDRLTKMAHFIPFRCLPTADIAADAFLSTIFRLHGLPESIVSDRGSQFTSAFWNRLCSLYDIEHSLSTANHPQTDGQTERVNAILEQYLRCFINERQKIGLIFYHLLSSQIITLYSNQLIKHHFSEIMDLILKLIQKFHRTKDLVRRKNV